MSSARPPVVGIYFKDPLKTDDPISKPKFKEAYYELMSLLADRGARPVIVRSVDTYLGNGVFEKCWDLGASSEPQSYIDSGKVELDVLFNRGALAVDMAFMSRAVNNPQLDAVASNKRATQIKFPGLMPKAVVITKSDDIAAINTLPGTKVVIKKPFGHGGSGVFIESHYDAIKRAEASHDADWVVQEFIDTSKGIPGLIDCEHDLRVLLLDGRPAAAIVRPRDLWLRGEHDMRVVRSKMIPASHIPTDLLPVLDEIDRPFQGMLRYYSADFAYDGTRWYLIELNATPGLNPSNRGSEAVKVLNELADYLLAQVSRR